MLDSTVKRGAEMHPDPDVLVSLYHGMHDYGSIEEADEAYWNGEISYLEHAAIEEGFMFGDQSTGILK